MSGSFKIDVQFRSSCRRTRNYEESEARKTFFSCMFVSAKWKYFPRVYQKLFLCTEFPFICTLQVTHILNISFWKRTPWSRVLLEKLTGSQLVKKFPIFYGTRKFITAFTSACHMSLTWARAIHTTLLRPTFCRSILILSFHLLVLPASLFPSCPHQNPVLILSLIRDTCPAHLIRLYSIIRVIFGEQWISWSSLCRFLHSPVTSFLLGPNISSAPCCQTPSAYIPSSMWATKFNTHKKHQAKLYLRHYVLLFDWTTLFIHDNKCTLYVNRASQRFYMFRHHLHRHQGASQNVLEPTKL